MQTFFFVEASSAGRSTRFHVRCLADGEIQEVSMHEGFADALAAADMMNALVRTNMSQAAKGIER